MSSAATSSEKQIEANRQNARHSTGPRTAEGKAASSRNATRYGLFAAHLQVREDEADDYEMLRNEFLDKYRREGVLEDCLALEMINAQWRLLRCTRAEAAIPALQNEANPVHDFANPAQTAINRARAAAELSLRRNMKTYKEMQTERFQRAEMLTEGPIHPDSLGMVPLKSHRPHHFGNGPCPPRLQSRQPPARRRSEITKRSHPGLRSQRRVGEYSRALPVHEPKTS